MKYYALKAYLEQHMNNLQQHGYLDNLPTLDNLLIKREATEWVVDTDDTIKKLEDTIAKKDKEIAEIWHTNDLYQESEYNCFVRIRALKEFLTKVKINKNDKKLQQELSDLLDSTIEGE